MRNNGDKVMRYRNLRVEAETASADKRLSCGKMESPPPSPPSPWSADDFEDDHVPLAFLLGTRAKHYAPSPSGRHKTSTKATTETPVATHNRHKGGSRAHTQASELFAPETHLWTREKEARRVLRETLATQSESVDSGGAHNGTNTSPSVTLAPMELLRDSKSQVMHQLREKQQLDLESANNSTIYASTLRPRNGHSGACDVVGSDEDEHMRTSSVHGLVRSDHSSTFLDVAGHATRIPMLSTLEAKQRHRRTMQHQNDRRARHAKDMHALLHEQQQFTKQALQATAAAATMSLAPHTVAHVDLSALAGLHGNAAKPTTQSTTSNNNSSSSNFEQPPRLSQDAVREQLEREQLLLRSRVQEKRQLELLTRQQSLAFHQQLKRATAQRAKTVKRPSFLATLQLDSVTIADEATRCSPNVAAVETPLANTPLAFRASTSVRDAAAAAANVKRQHVQRYRRMIVTTSKNQDDDDSDDDDSDDSNNDKGSGAAAHTKTAQVLQRQQREAFRQHGGLHLGGGFQSSKSTLLLLSAQSTSHKQLLQSPTATTAVLVTEALTLDRQPLLPLGGVTAHAVAITAPTTAKRHDGANSKQHSSVSTAMHK